jgi:hypothetical protein
VSILFSLADAVDGLVVVCVIGGMIGGAYPTFADLNLPLNSTRDVGRAAIALVAPESIIRKKYWSYELWNDLSSPLSTFSSCSLNTGRWPFTVS